MSRLHEHEQLEAKRNRWLFEIGCAILLIIPIAALFSLNRYAPISASAYRALLIILAACSILIFVTAIFVKKESRADVAQQFLDQGMSGSGGNCDPLARVLIALAMVGMICGAFMVIDAIKTTKVRLRVRRVDRFRAADILRMLKDSPAGLHPGKLLLHGEDPLELRRTIAYLIIYDWADISKQGDHLMMLPRWRRELRMPWSLGA